eukprot:scaffold80170_cov43-Prasinocladus_malaysianus.AAC.3
MQLRQMLEATQRKLHDTSEVQSCRSESLSEVDLENLHQEMEEALKVILMPILILSGTGMPIRGCSWCCPRQQKQGVCVKTLTGAHFIRLSSDWRSGRSGWPKRRRSLRCHLLSQRSTKPTHQSITQRPAHRFRGRCLETARKAAAAARAAEELADSAVQERDALRQVLKDFQLQEQGFQGLGAGADVYVNNQRLETEIQVLRAELCRLQEAPQTQSTKESEALRAVASERDGLGLLCQEQKDHLQWHQNQLTAAQLELEVYKARERQAVAINQLGDRALMRRAWARFRQACEHLQGMRESCLAEKQRLKARRHHCSGIERRWIRRWRLAALRSQAERVNLEVADQVWCLRLRRAALAAWKLWVEATTPVDDSECAIDPTTWRQGWVQHQVFAHWRYWCQHISLPHKQKASWGDTHCRHRLLAKAMCGLLQVNISPASRMSHLANCTSTATDWCDVNGSRGRSTLPQSSNA